MIRLQRNLPGPCAVIFLMAALTCFGSAHAAPELLEVQSRTTEGGAPVIVKVIVDAPANPRYVLLSPPNGDGLNGILSKAGAPAFGNAAMPFQRIRTVLKEAGAVAAVMDGPSDAPSGMARGWREDYRHFKDIGAVINALRHRYPSLPVYLVGYGTA